MKVQRNIILSVLLIFLTSGCSITAKVWKPYDKVTISSAKNTNPNGKGRPSPIQVKIYELASRSTLDNLDFDRAFYNAETLLSDELISTAEYTIQPGDEVQHVIKLTKLSRFVAIVAGFIDIDNARWKHIYKVKPHGHYSHFITINAKEITEGKPAKEHLSREDIKEAGEDIKEAGEDIKEADETRKSIKNVIKQFD